MRAPCARPDARARHGRTRIALRPLRPTGPRAPRSTLRHDHRPRVSDRITTSVEALRCVPATQSLSTCSSVIRGQLFLLTLVDSFICKVQLSSEAQRTTDHGQFIKRLSTENELL